VTGGRAGGEAAWLEEEDATVVEPGLVEEGDRDAGGLAGAGRRLENGARARPQRLGDRGQDASDRKLHYRRITRYAV
jgi:hypothetical protein